MSLLSDEEIEACVTWKGPAGNPFFNRIDFARAIESAILAKLASAELPEPQKYPADCFMREVNVCDALAVSIAIQQAHAQGFAAGAAAQLSSEPVGCVVVHGNHKVGMLPAQRDIEAGEMLYTRREAK